MDVLRQVAEKGADLGQRLGLVLDQIVDDAVAGMDLWAAELFLGRPPVERALDHRGAGDHHLALLGHDREMRGDEARGRQSGDRAHRCRGDRHRLQRARDRAKSWRRGDRLADSTAAGPGNAAAAALVQADQRHFVLQRQFLGIDALAQARSVGRAALEGEVLAADDAGAPGDGTKAEDEIGRREAGEIAGGVALGAAGRRAELAK